MSRFFLSISLLFFLIISDAVAGSGLLDQKPALESAITHSSQTGKAALKWESEQQALLYELQDLELKAQWELFQNQQLDRWSNTEAKEIKSLMLRLEQAAENRRHLAPLMEVVYVRLEDFIAGDLPFLKEERKRRLAFLRQSFDDPSASLSDQLSVLLEAIQVEVDYGLTAHAHDIFFTKEEMEGAGQITSKKDKILGKRQYHGVELRIGRIGLFRVLGQAQEAFRYNQTTRAWEQVPKDQVHELTKAIEMIQKKRVAQIAELPVGLFQDLMRVTLDTEGGEQ